MVDAHFELTDECKVLATGERVFRIRAVRDIPERFVKAGELGGFVSSTHTADGKLRIGPSAWVAGDAIVAGDARISGNALVYENACVFGSARVKGWARIGGNARVFDNAVVKNNARVRQNAEVSGQARVAGQAVVSESARVFGDAVIEGNAHIYGGSWVEGHAHVSGHAQLSGDAYVCDKARIAGSAYLMGNTAVSGEATVIDAAIIDGEINDHARITDGRMQDCCVEGDAQVNANLPDCAHLGEKMVVTHPEECVVFHPLGVEDCPVTVAKTTNGKIATIISYYADNSGKRLGKEQLIHQLQTQGLDELFEQQLQWAKNRVAQVRSVTAEEVLDFRLTGETKTLPDGTVVYRIEATRDLPFFNVSKGDKGGWVPSTHNSQGIPRLSENSWLGDEAMLLDEAILTCEGRATGNACVKGNAVVKEEGWVERDVTLTDNTEVIGGFVTGTGTIAGSSTVRGGVEIELVGPLTDVRIRDNSDHRRFGPLFGTGIEVFLTRRAQGAQLSTRLSGVWREGTLDELVPENPILDHLNNRDWWETVGNQPLLVGQSPRVQALVLEEYAQLRELIVTVLKQWDS
ncbi:MAG: hypothetical protein Q4D85_11050 [Corynebacterium sp.]|uniref:hypothetical protein n=1 Tax=Corynebacterium sp. TaxID=1720 RepID=UPI0026DC29AB|nr:hypothetical protein [Corynebacterium sp.]MDO5099271.1 hypothetical protein [Corynebacterium sp.]